MYRIISIGKYSSSQVFLNWIIAFHSWGWIKWLLAICHWQWEEVEREALYRQNNSAKYTAFECLFHSSNGFVISMIALYDISIFEEFILHFRWLSFLAASLHILKEINKLKKSNKQKMTIHTNYIYAGKNWQKNSRGKWKSGTFGI